jgi:hypothetical protein
VVILRTYRQVERDLGAIKRDLADVELGTPEATRLDAETIRLIDEWARLRAEYMWLIEAARSQHRPEPPAWPEQPST